MKKILCRILISLFVLLSSSHYLFGQETNKTDSSEVGKVNWISGPGTAKMKEIADLDLKAGFYFADGEDTRYLMKKMGNIVSNKEVGFFAQDSSSWFVLFEFDEIGYVKDDEKNDLDADAILESIKESNDAANEYRTENNFPTLEIIGWEVKPYFDDSTKNLEWSIKAKNSNNELVINHNTRILGRQGVMNVTLVVNPDEYYSSLSVFRKNMQGFHFQKGNRYAEYREGDKIAEYGLGALVVGGAAAVAAKSGFFKVIGKFLIMGWKLIVVAFIAVGSYIKKIFSRKKEEKNTSENETKQIEPIENSLEKTDEKTGDKMEDQ